MSSVRPSVRPYRSGTVTAKWLKAYALADPNMGDVVQREHPNIRVE